MILIENPEKFAEFQEVSGDYLHDLTQNGWIVVAILGGGILETRNLDSPTNDHSYRTREEAFVINQPRYLIGKYRDRVLDNLRTDLQAERNENKTLREIAERAGEREEKNLETINEQKMEIEQRNKQLNKWNGEVKDKAEQIRTMETDLGKLRQAIGDLKFKEIVGEG